jgi:hypothetical protein
MPDGSLYKTWGPTVHAGVTFTLELRGEERWSRIYAVRDRISSHEEVWLLSCKILIKP